MKISINFLVSVLLVVCTLVVLSVCATVCTEVVNSNDSCATVENVNDESNALTEIKINSKEDLKPLFKGSSSSNNKYILMKDIDLSGENWGCIGTTSSPFTGIFDGKGHKISNVNLTTNEKYCGMFCATNEATIKNLKLSNVNVHDVKTKDGDLHVGGLIGDAGYNTNIENVSVDNVKITKINADYGYVHVGGLVGYAYHDRDLTFKGNISVKNLTINDIHSNTNFFGKYGGKAYIGGVIGDIYSNLNIKAKAKVSIDTVNISKVDSNDYMYIGGFSGMVEPLSRITIDGSIDMKNLTIDNVSVEDEDVFIGGFAGEAYYGNITLSDVNIDTLKVSNVNADSYMYIGGFVGNGSNISINGCINMKNLTMNDLSVDYYDLFIGGFAGKGNGGKIILKDMNVDTLNMFNIKADNHLYLGGFVGGLISNVYLNGCINMKNLTMNNIIADDDDLIMGSFIGDGDIGCVIFNNDVNIDNVKITNVDAKDVLRVDAKPGFGKLPTKTEGLERLHVTNIQKP